MILVFRSIKLNTKIIALEPELRAVIRFQKISISWKIWYYILNTFECNVILILIDKDFLTHGDMIKKQIWILLYALKKDYRNLKIIEKIL